MVVVVVVCLGFFFSQVKVVHNKGGGRGKLFRNVCWNPGGKLYIVFRSTWYTPPTSKPTKTGALWCWTNGVRRMAI